MGTKYCTKIFNFSTRFSCENLAVEDSINVNTKFDFTVDEGKEWLNPSREKN